MLLSGFHYSRVLFDGIARWWTNVVVRGLCMTPDAIRLCASRFCCLRSYTYVGDRPAFWLSEVDIGNVESLGAAKSSASMRRHCQRKKNLGRYFVSAIFRPRYSESTPFSILGCKAYEIFKRIVIPFLSLNRLMGTVRNIDCLRGLPNLIDV